MGNFQHLLYPNHRHRLESKWDWRPLLSALFADKIDNIFVVCLFFVAIVGTAFAYLRNRLGQLEESLKDLERMSGLEDVNDEIME